MTTMVLAQCADEDCRTNACLEHPACDGDHTYEQHHDPSEHCGRGRCYCPGYGDLPSIGIVSPDMTVTERMVLAATGR